MYMFTIFASMEELVVLFWIIVIVSILARMGRGKVYDIPEPFACGSEEVCYCEESKDCKKKK